LFSADTETLQHTDQDQCSRRPDADLRIIRQQTNQERTKAYYQYGDDQRLLAANAITEMPETRCAQWPRDKANSVGRERSKRPDQRVAAGEKFRTEHEHRRGAVDEENRSTRQRCLSSTQRRRGVT